MKPHAAILATLVLAGCASPGATAPTCPEPPVADVVVRVLATATTFDPEAAVLEVGDVIAWINCDTEPHRLTSRGKAWPIERIVAPQQATTFVADRVESFDMADHVIRPDGTAAAGGTMRVAVEGPHIGPATTFRLRAQSDGGLFMFRDDASREANPTLLVPRSMQITVTIQNEGDGVHNLVVRDRGSSGYVQADGEETTLSFVSPASGTLEYWCGPHTGSGMTGVIRVI